MKGMKQKLAALFCDRENRIDNTKTITFLSFVLGWIVALIAVFKGSTDAVYFFAVMVGAGSGLTVTKGVVDIKQKAQSKVKEPL